MPRRHPSSSEPPPNFRPRFHRRRTVRAHHASGSWTTSIGKALDRSKTRLRPKDWYFKDMTEAEAIERANRVQRDWEFLVNNWQSLYAPTLRVLGSPFAEVPHWQPAMSNRAEPAPDEIEALHAEPPTAEDLALAYADVSLRGVYSLFEQHEKVAVAQGDRQQTSQDALLKSLRSALRFFPDGLKMQALTHAQLQEAKSAMLKKLGRRTVKNRMVDLRRMLKWFYDSDYGKDHEKPSHFESVFTITSATRTDVKPYPPATLKILLAGANEREQLYLMLALNCGMYQSDIGRLTLDEIDVEEGYVFWDREKEPTNPFNVRHDLWPETLRLVRKFVQAKAGRPRYSIDYRHGTAERVDCSKLAFVDAQGNPLYRITPGGKAYDKIGKAIDRLNARIRKADAKAIRYKFNHLRKSTNQAIREAVGREIGAEKARLVSIEEISQMFLAQREGLLARLYSQTREIGSATVIYGAMNRFLAHVRDDFRRAGVFDCLNGRPARTRGSAAKRRRA